MTGLSVFPFASAQMQQSVRSLHKRSVRETEQKCFIEGEHLCSEYADLLVRGVVPKPEVVLVDSETVQTSNQGLLSKFASSKTPIYQVSPKKFALLSDAQTPQGILAVISYPLLAFETNKPLIILDKVADPGNVGTIIRTAEWFGVRNILLGEGSADRFNPKTLRATMGAAFRCAVHSTDNLAETLQKDFADYRLYGASLQASAGVESLDFSGKVGIVMGSEAHGISPAVQTLLHGIFRLEQAQGSEAESLNVAVAAGICLFCLHNAVASS